MKSTLFVLIYYLVGAAWACENHFHDSNITDTTTKEARELVADGFSTVPGSPFKVGAHQWSSFEAFVHSGARCQTANLSRAEIEHDRNNVETLRTARGWDRQNNRPQRQLATITIDVYWHKIRSSSGGGSLSTQKIADSISVLNAAYAAPGFQFQLIETDETTNDSWYTASPGSTTDAMKKALHKGTTETLNVYSTSPGDGVLGFATLPSSRAGGKDGVVIRYSTTPRGSAYPYNKGNTLVHEVSAPMRLDAQIKLYHRLTFLSLLLPIFRSDIGLV